MALERRLKKTEVGNIPEDWEVAVLGPKVKLQSGESPSKFRFSDSGVPYFKVEQLNNDSKYLRSTPYYSDSVKTVPKGSLIFPKRGASILTNKVRILDQDSFMDTNLMTVTPTDGSISSEYLFYTLIKIELWRIADTTSIPQINNKHIIPLALPLPPTRDEQEAIANALSDADALIESLEKLIAKKRLIKKGAMQELLTGKRRLPGFNDEWRYRTLADISELKNGYAFKSQSYADNGQFNIVTIANVQDGYMDLATASKTNHLPKDLQPHHRLNLGDILISMTGNVGRVCRNKFDNCLLNQRVGKLIPHDVNADFLYCVLRDERFLNQMISAGKGGAQPNLSASDILAYSLQLPASNSEQCAIATIVNSIDAEITAYESKLSKARLIKQGMMQELLTGRIRFI